MRKSPLQSIIILSICMPILFSSCADALHPTTYYFYTPFPVNVPLLKQKNELQITAQGVGGLRDDQADKGKVLGGNVQAAYAVSNHIGIIGSYGYTRESERYNTNSSHPEAISYKKNMVEIGAGYFTQALKSKKMRFEVYAGYSTGKSNISSKLNGSVPDGVYEGRIQRFYLQPALTWNIADKLRLSWAIRTSLVKIHNAGTYYPDVSLYELEKNQIAFLEPSFVIQFPVGSLSWIRGHAQLTGAIKINNNDDDYRNTVGSLGFTILPLKKKK